MDFKHCSGESSINCQVSACAHHNKTQNVCKLDAIQVGCCGPSTESCACTECNSFQKK